MFFFSFRQKIAGFQDCFTKAADQKIHPNSNSKFISQSSVKNSIIKRRLSKTSDFPFFQLKKLKKKQTLNQDSRLLSK